MNTQLLDRPVGQLVAEQPGRSSVFERWGIDYCCSGKKALSDACAIKQLDAESVLRDLEASDSKSEPPAVDWTSEPLDRLCDHIVTAHHEFLRVALPRLSMLTEKVAERHGRKDARLVELRDLLSSFRSEMEAHMEKEERLLFPAIRAYQKGEPVLEIEEPIRAMLSEHDDAGEALAKMRSLTSGFEPGPDACNTHRAMLHALAELEADMHQHVHKENNILFPRAIALASAAF